MIVIGKVALYTQKTYVGVRVRVRVSRVRIRGRDRLGL